MLYNQYYPQPAPKNTLEERAGDTALSSQPVPIYMELSWLSWLSLESCTEYFEFLVLSHPIRHTPHVFKITEFKRVPSDNTTES
jgi:hypothetical protein